MKPALPWLKVSDNRRFLAREDGTPFFWLGDTAWELFHKLNREDAVLYLKKRAEQRFTVIQAVALAEDDGLDAPNPYGKRPLLKNESGRYDPSMPDVTDRPDDYDYWDHVDYIVDQAAELGLYIALLPTWGDKYNLLWGKGPVVFNGSNARAYGAWLGRRYRDRSNIVWVLGGDRPLQSREHFEVVHQMAEGLREGDEGRHLMTFHPRGGESSSLQVHEESWLDFNMIQSGHMEDQRENDLLVAQDYLKQPTKPTLDAEPCYEDHPRSFKAENGYFDAADVRRAAYNGLLAGGFGHTYGHHSVWLMCAEPADYFIMDWKQALDRPGAWQMGHVRALMERMSMSDRIPDQTLIASAYSGANKVVAARGNDYVLCYTPNGLAFDLNMGIIAGDEVSASWHDPRTGEKHEAGKYGNIGVIKFTPPSQGRGEDWVLLLQS